MMEAHVVPKDKKIHQKTNYARSMIEKGHHLFPMASTQAKRTLRRIVEEDVNDCLGYRPNIGMPTRVTGAIGRADIMQLQKLKQELFDEVKDFHAREKDQKAMKQTDAQKMRNSSLKLVPSVTEKNEQSTVLEEELNPMNYAKVFADDKYLTYKPGQTGNKPLKQSFEEYFENRCF